MSSDGARVDFACAKQVVFQRASLLLVHLAICLGVASLFSLLPAIPLHPDDFIVRNYLLSPNFPIGTILLWIFLLISGFAYVAGVTEQRKNMFLSRKGNYLEIAKLLLCGPLVFCTGPLFAMADAAYQARCPSSIWFRQWADRSFQLMCGIEDASSSVVFVAAYNFSCFVIPFYFGLHITYPDKVMLWRSMGDKLVVPSRWRTYKRNELILLLVLVVVIGAFALFNLMLLVFDGLVVMYAIIYASGTFAFGALSALWWKTHEPHMHHYFIGLLAIPPTRFFNPISCAAMGFAAGVYVEGVARWSMASLWDRRSGTSGA